MTNKDRFIRAVARIQNYNSHKETKNKLLEKAFGSDTVIFDFDGVDELTDTLVDMTSVIFPNLSETNIKDNIEWYLYEAVGMDNPEVSDNNSDKTWIVNNSSVLYDMLEYFNNQDKNKEFDNFEKTMKA
jgi:hypothetical protein